MKYLGTTSVEMDAVTKKYVDDASSNGNTAYGWGNHATAGYLKTHQDISGKQDKITTTNKLSANLVSGLATVATSGKYSDLSGTPTIPTTLPASDVYAWAKKSSLDASDVPVLNQNTTGYAAYTSVESVKFKTSSNNDALITIYQLLNWMMATKRIPNGLTCHKVFRGTWYYVGNDNVLVEGTVGSSSALYIDLAGATVEFYGYINMPQGTSAITDSGVSRNYIVRITVASTVSRTSFPNTVWIWRDNGAEYSPSWKRLANHGDAQPASDVYAWAKAATKPTYNWGEITNSGAENIAEGSSDVTDNTEILTSYASNNGFADTNGKGIVYRRDAIKMFNYIKGKLPSWATKSSLAASDVPTLNQNTTGNAATATKLATSRSIWGQSFDGSADVSGILTGATGIAKYITDNWTDDNGNAHPWYGYDMRSSNTGVFSSVITDFFGMSLRTHFTNISLTKDGKVGINTYAPTQTLHVNGGILAEHDYGYYLKDANGEALKQVFFYANDFHVGNGSAAKGYNTYIAGDTIIFRTSTSTTEKMRVSADGNVGIGTTSPSAKLHVEGDVYAKGSHIFRGTFTLINDTNANLKGAVYMSSNGYLYIQPRIENSTYNVNTIINPKGGNVGIGTTSPTETLHVNGTMRSRYCRFNGIDGSIAGYVGRGSDTNNNIYIEAQTSDGCVCLNTNNNRRVTVTADGNVGIGTTSPSYKLQVNGDILTSGWSRATKGFYCHDTGVHYTYQDQANYICPLIYSSQNNVIQFSVGNSAWTTMHVNYYTPTYGYTPTKWIWRAGSSTSHADFEIGNLVATGNVAAYSDRRLKSHIQDFEYRGALSPKTYIKDGRQEIGFIAQEVRELYPELVMGNETENDFLSLNYGAITAVLAYQTNDHEARIKTLEAENERLKQMIVELQK